MKTQVTTIVLIACSLAAFGQDTTWINTFSQKVPDSVGAEYYRVSRGPRFEEYYFPSHQLRQQGAYVPGTEDEKMPTRSGSWTRFNEEGVLTSRSTYQEGELVGPDSSWYDSGQLQSAMHWDFGRLIGEYHIWFRDGQPKESRSYTESGDITGSWTKYYESGQPYWVVSFAGSDTLFRQYHESGQLVVEGHREEGRLLFDSVFDEAGEQLVRDGNGTMELRHGEILSLKGKLKNGQRTGAWKFYRSDGTLRLAVTYDKGQAYTVKLYSHEGDFLSEVPVPELMQKDEQNPFAVFICGQQELEPRPLNINELKRSIGYPNKARDAGIQGEVVVRLLVDQNGEVIPGKIYILQHVHPLLEDAILEQINNLRFTPAIQSQSPIRFWVNIPFNFKLLN